MTINVKLLNIEFNKTDSFVKTYNFNHQMHSTLEVRASFNENGRVS